MSTEENQPTDPLRELSIKQLIALGELESGADQSTAAAEAGVTRQTVNGWQNHHPAFKAELRRRLTAANEKQMAQVLRGNGIVLEQLLKAVQRGDAWAIKTWATHIGLRPVDPGTIGSTDTEKYIQDSAEARVERRRAVEAGDDLAERSPLRTPRRKLVEEDEQHLIEFFEELESVPPYEYVEYPGDDDPEVDQ